MEKYSKELNSIIDRIRQYSNSFDDDLIERAFEFSYNVHKDQLYISGEPYIEHCLKVVDILVELKMDYETVIGGLLHATTIDSDIDKQVIKEKFGTNIYDLVVGLYQISELHFRNKQIKQTDKLRKLVLSIARDIRVIFIKLADRLIYMRAINATLEKRNSRLIKDVGEKTMAIYVPLAHRLGISKIKQELEDLSFKFLEPKTYENIRIRLAESREDREKHIEQIVSIIKQRLSRAGILCKVHGRSKSIYSIHKKMINRGYSFDKINDILAIRIIVKDGPANERFRDCYAALSVVQNEFIPVHELYSDYIQNPRENGYQSIHAKVIYSPNSNGNDTQKIVEFQIRSEKMHDEAETGIAAHWLYKEGRQRLDEVEEKLIQLRQKIFDDAKDPDKFIQSLKIDDLFQNEIFVFSPDHDLWQLEKDSTPVDFAFHVHTDVGFHCIGAKVNGKMVPLNHRLKNGDMVEIITSNNQHPNQDWLKFVKTNKAKNKIKRWIKETQFQQSCKLGEELLNKTLTKFQISLKNDEINQIAKEYNYQDTSKFYAAIGRGDLTPTKIVHKIAPDKTLSEKNDSFLKRFIKLAWGIDNTVKVQGLDNLLINFGKCCQPLPGDRIIGFITKGRGVVIHRTDCKNVPKLLEDEDRNIDVQWAVNDSNKFVAKINMIAENNGVFLRDITDSLVSMNTNIVSMDMKTQDTLVSNVMVIEVLNLNHLNRIMNRVRKIKGVISVQRIDGNYSTLN